MHQPFELQMESQRAFTRLYASNRCLMVVRVGCYWSDAVSISVPAVLAPSSTCMLSASQQPHTASLHSCNDLSSTLLSSSHTMLRVKIIHSWLLSCQVLQAEVCFGVRMHAVQAS